MRRNRMWFVKFFVTAGGLLLPVGCMQLPYHAAQQLDQAKRDYQSQDYPAATTKLDGILRSYPNNPGAAEAYFVRALCHTELSNKSQAESDARDCIRLANDTNLTSDGHATLATLLYESDRTREALDHFSKAFKNPRGRSNEDVVMYRYALCLQREGQWREARIQFEQIFEHYPNTTTAQHARRLYDWPHDYYSIQCGAFRDSGSASAQSSQLRRAGLRSRVERLNRSGEQLHAVYVGQYARYGQAKDALPSVRRQVHDAFVMPQ